MMITLHDWVKRWQIPQEAFAELVGMVMVHYAPVENPAKLGSEARQQSIVRLDGSDHGVLLFRNNVGAGSIVDPKKLCEQCYATARGGFLRWGLANDTKQVNEETKSADLIGLRPVRITEAHVGKILGQFVSRECQEEGWQWTGTPRELAQLNWSMLIAAHGGDAQFATGKGSFQW
jgi:hypothetical protein